MYVEPTWEKVEEKGQIMKGLVIVLGSLNFITRIMEAFDG